MNLPPWIEVCNPAVSLGKVRYALFDFDGTISVIRHGWEQIMLAVMVESIGEGRPISDDITAEVTQFIDQSTGTLTIKQMQWLEAAVRRYGLAQTQRTAAEYKRIYNERLLKPVYERLASMGGHPSGRDAWMIQGVRDFLEQLVQRGIPLFLASGTDQEYVEKEAAALGVAALFNGHIYGAQGTSESDSKEVVMRRILDEQRLRGDQFLVVGDGPMEITYARQAGALTLGVAADEVKRAGLNERKRQRLLTAGADLIVTDFSHGAALAELLCGASAA